MYIKNKFVQIILNDRSFIIVNLEMTLIFCAVLMCEGV